MPRTVHIQPRTDMFLLGSALAWRECSLEGSSSSGGSESRRSSSCVSTITSLNEFFEIRGKEIHRHKENQLWYQKKQAGIDRDRECQIETSRDGDAGFDQGLHAVVDERALYATAGFANVAIHKSIHQSEHSPQQKGG